MVPTALESVCVFVTEGNMTLQSEAVEITPVLSPLPVRGSPSTGTPFKDVDEM